MDRYMNSVYKKDKSLLPPLSRAVRLAEDTGHMEIGEGVIWRMKVEPTQNSRPERTRRHPAENRSRPDSRIQQLYDRNINAAPSRC
jgi:hypothetical protein